MDTFQIYSTEKGATHTKEKTWKRYVTAVDFIEI